MPAEQINGPLDSLHDFKDGRVGRATRQSWVLVALRMSANVHDVIR
jgi:hypothetical protein